MHQRHFLLRLRVKPGFVITEMCPQNNSRVFNCSLRFPLQFSSQMLGYEYFSNVLENSAKQIKEILLHFYLIFPVYFHQIQSTIFLDAGYVSPLSGFVSLSYNRFLFLHLSFIRLIFLLLFSWTGLHISVLLVVTLTLKQVLLNLEFPTNVKSRLLTIAYPQAPVTRQEFQYVSNFSLPPGLLFFRKRTLT